MHMYRMRGSKSEDTLKRWVYRSLFARTKKSLVNDNPPRLINTPPAEAAFDEVLIAT